MRFRAARSPALASGPAQEKDPVLFSSQEEKSTGSFFISFFICSGDI
jgi:hypothetical protein